MKKLSLLYNNIFDSASATFAQKYGFVDTEYILNNIPSYAAAQEKLDNLSEEMGKRGF